MERWVWIIIVFVLLLIAVPISIKIISDKVVEKILKTQDNIFNENKVQENLEKTDEFFEKFTPQVTWEFKNGGWVYLGNPPACQEPLTLGTPVDTNLVTSILYPGQIRGDDFKPHGGFRFDDSYNNDITVRAPLDGKILAGGNYLESGEIQYLFDFINDCGIKYRFDHLVELSPKLQEIADEFSEPKEGDSRTVFTEPVIINKGEVLATAVGIQGNVFVDFGVYDLRKKNEASQDSAWLKEHDGDQAPYAVCWLDLLSDEDSNKLKSLPGADGVSGKESDYC